MDQVDLVILSKIKTARETGDFSPSMNELADAARLSVGGVHRRLQRLVRLGLIDKPPANQARSYRVSKKGLKLLSEEAQAVRPFVAGNREKQWPPR